MKAAICQLYIKVICNYYSKVLIVFDGYGSGPTTKDETHQQRTSSEMGVDVNFILDMLLKMKKKQFLANTRNKQKFINLLGLEMQKEDDIQVKHSLGDADYDIVISPSTIGLTIKACDSCRE